MTMKSRKALLLDELSELDTDRVKVYQALRVHWTTDHHRFDWSDPAQKAEYDAGADARAEAYMSMLAMVNEFRARLSKVLGIRDQPVGTYDSAELLDYIDIYEPILGGDIGVITYIDYGRSRKYYDYDRGSGAPAPPNYKVRMTKDTISAEAEASNTENLLTVIDRGYTCLRIMEKGTRYYHSNN